MNDATRTPMPAAALRTAVAADFSPVRPLDMPLRRALAVMPIVLLLLLAAPLWFGFRDLVSLGWIWSWGASGLQLAAGFALIVAALREAIPGRNWSRHALAALIVAPMLLLVAITFGTWAASPVAVARRWIEIGAMCLAGSVVSALPAVVLAAVLAVRAYPTRPAVSGALAGFGAGLMADAGWRLFCHFSEPTHVLAAHVGGVVCATITGSVFVRVLDRHRDRSSRSRWYR